MFRRWAKPRIIEVIHRVNDTTLMHIYVADYLSVQVFPNDSANLRFTDGRRIDLDPPRRVYIAQYANVDTIIQYEVEEGDDVA